MFFRDALAIAGASVALGAFGGGCLFVVNESPDGSGASDAGSTSTSGSSVVSSAVSGTGSTSSSGVGGSGGAGGGGGVVELPCVAPGTLATVKSIQRTDVVDVVMSFGHVYFRLANGSLDAELASAPSTLGGGSAIASFDAVSLPARITPDDDGVILTHGGASSSYRVAAGGLDPTHHVTAADSVTPLEVVRIDPDIEFGDVDEFDRLFALSNGSVYPLRDLLDAGTALDGGSANDQNVDRLATYEGGLLWTYNGDALARCPLAFGGAWGCNGIATATIPWDTTSTYRRILPHEPSDTAFVLADGGPQGGRVWRAWFDGSTGREIADLEGSRDLAVAGDYLVAARDSEVVACCLDPQSASDCVASEFTSQQVRAVARVNEDHVIVATSLVLALVRIDPPTD